MIDIHVRAISQEIPQPLAVTRISLKITYLKFRSNLPGANELNRLFSSSGTQMAFTKALIQHQFYGVGL